jgi:hypothetical protein
MSAKNLGPKVRLALMAAVLVSTAATAIGRARGAECPAAATVQGSARIVPEVRAILRAHGIAPDVGDCSLRGVRASLVSSPEPRGYRLHIEDAFGRASDRVVSDAETAASLIESWVPPAAEDRPPVSRPPSASVSKAPAAALAATGGSAARWRLAGALELSRGNDRSLWYGGEISACGRVAALCLGGRLRVARDSGLEGSTYDRVRTAAELLMLAALPLQVHTFTLTPMVGVGLGWIHAESAAFALDLDDVPTDLGVRVEAAASLAVPLSEHLSLAAEVGASWGRSIASSTGESDDGFAVRPPAGYLRAGIACQYTP